jgi:hypothetical protein
MPERMLLIAGRGKVRVDGAEPHTTDVNTNLGQIVNGNVQVRRLSVRAGGTRTYAV